METTHITQGEFATGEHHEMMITTILGSCVSACIWDPEVGIGGMNHILLPFDTTETGDIVGCQVNSMELLINSIVRLGGIRTRLEAKVFGGGKMISGFSDVGLKNGEFVISYLRDEGISCLSQSLGGEQARRIQFWPHTGRARQKMLGKIDFPEVQAPGPIETLNDEIELF